LHLRERVVVERLHEDGRVDQAEDVLAGTQVGGIDHRLHPSTRGDDTGGSVVVPAVQVGSRERYACIALVEPDRVASAAASAGSDLAYGGASPARLLALGRGLLPGLPA